MLLAQNRRCASGALDQCLLLGAVKEGASDVHYRTKSGGFWCASRCDGNSTPEVDQPETGGSGRPAARQADPKVMGKPSEHAL